MSGVYGDFLTAFPELRRITETWSKPDGSDKHTIIAVWLPDAGDGFRRMRFARGNSNALTITAHDAVLIPTGQNVHEGDYVRHPDEGYAMRLVVDMGNFDRIAGFAYFTAQRVQGATEEQHTKDLKVKRPEF